MKTLLQAFSRGAIFSIVIALLLACTPIAVGPNARRESSPTLPSHIEIEVAGVEGPVPITFAANESEWKAYEPLVAEFERQHPAIDVQLVPWPYASSQDALTPVERWQQMATAADTLLIGHTVFSHIPAVFQDVQPLADTEADFAADDFWPGALSACQDAGGRQLGLPVRIHFRGIFYDAGAFDAAGLPRPAPGWTWDDFRKAVAALAQFDADYPRYGYAENFPTLPSPLIAAALAQEDGQIVPATLQEAVGWYVDLVRAGQVYLPDGDGIVIAGESPLPQSELSALFQSAERPVMWPGGLESPLPGAADRDLASRHDTLAPFPIGAGVQRTSPAWATCAAISAGSRAPRQAWQWIDFLSRHWIAEKSPRDFERFAAPGRISAADSGAYWQQFSPERASTIRYILQHTWYDGENAPQAGLVTKALWRASGGADFAVALGEAQDYLASLPSTATPTPATGVRIATPQATLPPGVREVRYFYDAFGAEREALQALARAYHQSHPDVQVRVTTSLQVSTAGERLGELTRSFDCFTEIGFGAQDLDRLLPLDGWLDAQGGGLGGDFDPALLERYRYEDHQYALPAIADVQVVAYNAALLAKRGLQPPALDWTFDDFIALSRAATSTDAHDRSYGVLFNPWDDLFLAGRDALAADFSADPPLARFDSPAFAGALAWMDEMNRAGVFLRYDGEPAQLQRAFAEGQVAFWPAMLSEPNQSFAGQTSRYAVGLAPLPAMPAARFISWGTKGHFIASRAGDPQACWDWIVFLSEQAAVFKGIPARRSVAESVAWEAVVGHENAAIYRQALKNALQSAESMPRYGAIRWPLVYWQSQAVTAVLDGEDYPALLPVLQQKATAYLSCALSAADAHLDATALNEEIGRCAKEADPDGNWGR
ncbi:MAG: extracellular solute-binding protein [Chloroflexota bacterium]